MRSRMYVEYSGIQGIKDYPDPLHTDPKHLTEAENVDIDDAGKISRRDGFSAAVVAGACHSLWANSAGNLALYCTGTQFRILEPNNTSTTLRSDLLPNRRMSYVEINGDVYYTNTQFLGIVRNRALAAFPAIVKDLSSAMPAGSLIEYYNGRLYVASNDTIWYSAPMDFGRTEIRKSFMRFPGVITLMKATDDGIYLSFTGSTGFLSGDGPKKFTYKHLFDYDAIPYTSISFGAHVIGGDKPVNGTAVWWESTEGPCIGLPGGQAFNIGEAKYNAPTGIAGASLLRENANGTTQVLTTLIS